MSTSTAPPATEQTVEVGDFFVCSWGYDQTNVDFYKVIEVTPSGKSIKVQQWSKAFTSRGGPQENVVPGDAPTTVRVWNEDYSDQTEQDAPVTMHRIKRGWSTPAFTVNSFSVAQKWDGTPEWQTGAGWGR